MSAALPLETRERAVYLAAEGLVVNAKATVAVAVMYCEDADPHGLFVGAWSPELDRELVAAMLEKALEAVRTRGFKISRPPS